MKTEVRMDKAGRIVVPKPMRERLHLRAGDPLELQADDGMITLRPRPAAVKMRKKHGLWVADIGRPISVEEAAAALRGTREERLDKLSGRGT